MTTCDALHGMEQLWFGVGHGIRFRGVQTSSILQTQILVEAEEIRCADGSIRTSDRLFRVDQVGEREVVRFCKDLHVFERVLRILGDVVGHNRRDAYGLLLLQRSARLHEAFCDGLDIRAMVADKDDEGSIPASYVRQFPGFPVDSRQGEVWCFPPEVARWSFFRHYPHPHIMYRTLS